MKIDELRAAADTAEEAKFEEILDREKAPLEEDAAAADARAAAATTQLATKTNEWAAEKTELEKTIEALQNAQPGPVPTRPSFGTIGVTTRITTPTELNGVNLIGPLKVQTTEFDLYDFEADVSAGMFTTATNVIQVDGQALFGRVVIANGVIRAAKPSPYLSSGITAMNALIFDVDISGTIDGINLVGDAIVSGDWWIHDLAQFGPGTPGVGHADGAHCDAIALGVGIKRAWFFGGRATVGQRTVAGSLSALMVNPGAPTELRFIGTELSGGVPINMPQTTLPSVLEFTGVRFGKGPVGPYPTPTSSIWMGESIIAPQGTVAAGEKVGANHKRILAALDAGKSTLLDGSPVTVKKG